MNVRVVKKSGSPARDLEGFVEVFCNTFCHALAGVILGAFIVHAMLLPLYERLTGTGRYAVETIEEAPQITAEEFEHRLNAILERDGPAKYRPGDRRDPFLPFPGMELPLPENGFQHFAMKDLTLSDVLDGHEGLQDRALFAGPDGKFYVQAVGDSCLDGVITDITEGSVVFRQKPPATSNDSIEVKLIEIHLY